MNIFHLNQGLDLAVDLLPPRQGHQLNNHPTVRNHSATPIQQHINDLFWRTMNVFFGDIFLMKSYSEFSCKRDRAIPSPTLFWWETFWQDWRQQTWCHRWPRGHQRSAPGNPSRSPLLVPYKRWIGYWGKGTNAKHVKGFFSPAMYPSILLKKNPLRFILELPKHVCAIGSCLVHKGGEGSPHKSATPHLFTIKIALLNLSLFTDALFDLF